jgi:hypothetical protein
LLGRCTAARSTGARAGSVSRRIETRSLSKTGCRKSGEKPSVNYNLPTLPRRKMEVGRGPVQGLEHCGCVNLTLGEDDDINAVSLGQLSDERRERPSANIPE